MELFLFFLFITLGFSVCPNNINSYNKDIDNGFIVDLQNLPDKIHLEKFILGNFFIPNPVLSSYFAYQTRYIMEHLDCFNKDNNTVIYSLDGSIKFSGNLENKDSLSKLIIIFDEITKDVLYSSQKVSLEKFTDDLIFNYNFECIKGVSILHPQIRSIDNCDRMIIVEPDFKSHVFGGLLKIIRNWIN